MATAPPKRPFWQLWKLPETFSQREKCVFQLCSAGALLVLSRCSACSLQKEHRSPIPKGFRVRTCAVTATPPERPFWQLWKPPKAFSRGETCFPPSCSLQEAHGSSRLRGFRVRTFAVTAAPPKRPFWHFWKRPKAFSGGETCFPAAGRLKRHVDPLRKAKMQQNDAGNPADKFFMLDKSKRAVFRQILAGDPLEAQAVHFEASRKQK